MNQRSQWDNAYTEGMFVLPGQNKLCLVKLLMQRHPEECSELTVWRSLSTQLAIDEREEDGHAAKVHKDMGYWLHGKVYKQLPEHSA